MNQSKPFGSAPESQPGTPAKPASAATARPAGVPTKPATAAPTRVASAPARSGAELGSKPTVTRPGAAPAGGKSNAAQPPPTTGRVVHDERGNAVWDWLKQTGRSAIESTTRMLRKLEAPELEVEQTHEEELRIQPDNGNSGGGGYDPYNQPTKSRRTPIK
jgi:hypothetical protein